MKCKEYKPYPCEVCKMSKIDRCYTGQFNNIYCRRYEKEVSTYPNDMKEINDPCFKGLENKCKCNKSYPSKLKEIDFKISAFLRTIDDIRFHRNEE